MTNPLLAWSAPASTAGVPWDIADAVELWAREQGRHGRVVWNPVTRCHVIELSLKSDDPRMKAWRDGKLRHEPSEQVFLHEWDKDKRCYVKKDIHQMGADGVRAFLDRGNMWSGRHRAANIHDACQQADRAEQAYKEQIREAAVENARLRARDERRSALGHPLVSVPATLEP